MSLTDKAKLALLRHLLPKDEKAKEELAKLWLPRSPHSIWLGWDDVDMGGKRVRKVGTPVADDDVARKMDVEAAAMPIGEHGDMIYHDAEKWTALKAPTTEKWLKHPGGAAAPVWSDLPTAASPFPAAYEDEQYRYKRIWQSWKGDDYDVVTSGTVNVAPGTAYVYIEVKSSGGHARLEAMTGYDATSTYYGHSWDRDTKFKCMVDFPTYAAQSIWLIWGNVSSPDTNDTNHKVGFRLKDDTLQGVAANGSAFSSVNLETYTSAAWHKTLECVFTPGVKAEFYVNGAKLGELTTNLPSGSSYAHIYMQVWVYAADTDARLYVYDWRWLQTLA